jgi:hypothetical protein
MSPTTITRTLPAIERYGMNEMSQTGKEALQIAGRVTAAVAACVGTFAVLMLPVVTAL